MILVEECRARLDEPVDGLLPELAGRQVLRRPDGPVDDTVPARRAITLRDLLTFRLGFGMDFEALDGLPIHEAVNERMGVPLGAPHPPTTLDLDEWIRRLGTLPLMYQPGERWLYNTGSYVLGLLIERASGQPLETFFQERIFEPLGMHDTALSVPADKLDRLPPGYMADPASGSLQMTDPAEESQWSRPPVFADGAGGLVSTVDDYLAFGQMLLDGGRCGKTRLLSRLSVEAMTTNQLTPQQKAASGTSELWETRGWGFGVSVVTARDGVAAVPGRYGWDGGYGTSWASDPREQLVGVLMTQCMGFPPAMRVYQDFWTSA
jgi:CubicO group peptidase (beta-lactamase class C family)